MYLPLHHGQGHKYFFRIPVTKLCFLTVSLPLFAFLTCVLMTMYKDFENANHTHCKVPNIFPSISASIGNYEPQITIWQTAIYIHAPLRAFIIYLRWNHYTHIIHFDLRSVVNITVLLNCIENLALVGLTYWNSTLHYPSHEFCFKTFIATSILYMLLVIILLTKYRRKSSISKSEAYSIKVKLRMLILNVTSFAFAAFFFLRHNKLCEPYVYSMFGFSEYIVVVSNIIFHLTTALDLTGQHVYFTSRGVSLQ